MSAGGAANTGAVVSLVNVMVWDAEVILLQLSATVQVLVTDREQPVPDSGLSVNVAVSPVEQLSATVAVPNAALMAEESGLQGTAVGGVSVITGAMVSCTVMSWVTVVVLPQESVMVHVLVMTAGQVPDGGVSVPITDPEVSQLSV